VSFLFCVLLGLKAATVENQNGLDLVRNEHVEHLDAITNIAVKIQLFYHNIILLEIIFLLIIKIHYIILIVNFYGKLIVYE